MTQKWLSNIVGQARAKRKLGMHLDAYLHSHIFPTALFIGPRGYGKTAMMRAIGKHLALFENGHYVMARNPESGKMEPKWKEFRLINCSTIKSLKQFVQSVIGPQIVDKDVTVAFDEASEIPKAVTMALLDICQPSGRPTEFTYDGITYNFDFSRQTFLFATTEPQSIFHALKSRYARFDLEEYTAAQMAEIQVREMRKANEKVKLDPAVLDDMVPFLRGEPRQCEHMARDIKDYLLATSRTLFGPKQWEELKAISGFHPLGVTDSELRILQILFNRSNTPTPLRRLASITGFTEDSISKDHERYLQRLGFMEVEKAGRVITQRGRDYLDAMSGRIRPAKKKPTFRSANVAS